MLIAVVSDTHKHPAALYNILKKTEDVNMIIHLGDNTADAEYLSEHFKGKVISVRGNCDFSSFIPSERIEIIEDKTILITHGHKYDVKYDLLKLKFRALEVSADIVLFGHTHVSQLFIDEGIYFVNPGSAAVARDGSNSMAVIDIKDDKVYVNLRIL